MAKLSELTEEQLQQQLAKAAQRFKQATDNEDKLKIKKLHSAIKSELQRRQDTIDVAPEQSQTRLQEEWLEQSAQETPQPSAQQSDPASAPQETHAEAPSSDKPSTKKGLKKPGPVGKKKMGAKTTTSEAKKSSPKTPSASPQDHAEESPKKSFPRLWIGIGAAVVVLIGLAVLFFSSDTHSLGQGSAKTATQATAPTAPPTTEAQPSAESPSNPPAQPAGNSSTLETPKAE